MKTVELFEYDRKFLPKTVAGIDEAGRGPLAGPVVAACVIMPLNEIIDGINDSKKLGENKRERLYALITEKAVAYGVGIAEREKIDEINILNATKLAMKSAYENMGVMPDIVLVDAVKGLDISCECVPIIKGDATSYNIAAASVIAKVTRDRLMRGYAEMYPEYDFSRNKGYGTANHITALKRFGKCPIHRNTFIKNFIGEQGNE